MSEQPTAAPWQINEPAAQIPLAPADPLPVVEEEELGPWREVMHRLASQDTEGAWMACSPDFSEVAVFSSEIECLRYAVAGGLTARRIKFGVDLHDQL